MNRKDLVSVAGKLGPFENVRTAMQRLDLSVLRGNKVLVKPNIGRSASPGRGYNTHPDAIAGVVQTLLDSDAASVSIGESPLVGIDTFEAFRKGGVEEIAKRYEVELIDMDAGKPLKVAVPGGRVLESTKICSAVPEHDIVVSVPVAKTHMHTGVTLGIKNMKGCLWRHEKVRYHQLEYLNGSFTEKTLDAAISDLASILLPDMTVVDGYIGMEGLGPSGGEPVKSDFAVASYSPMGADVVSCMLMGIDPEEVPHLRLISERQGFKLKPDAYEVIPADLSDFVHPYKRPPTDISLEFEDMQIYDKESCSACLSTLMLFLRRFGHDMRQYVLHDGRFHIAIGKGAHEAPEGTLFVGNCTRFYREKGVVVKGCPPVPTRIYEAVTGREPDENEPEVE